MKRTDAKPTTHYFPFVATILLFAFIVLLVPIDGSAQGSTKSRLRDISANQNEKVSIAATMTVNDALLILSEMSKRFEGKLIINPMNLGGVVGEPIQSTHWRNALELILEPRGLWYEEYPDHILITELSDSDMRKEARKSEDLYEEQQVLISAIFFEANMNKLRELGSSWGFWNGDSLQAAANKSADQALGLFEVRWVDELRSGLNLDSVSATFKALERENAGEVLASPQVVVQSGEEGRIQVGADYTVTTEDFAGNTITQFFSTGSIIQVTPIVHKVDTTTFIQLEVDVQKSSANATGGELGIEVAKSQAQTMLLMLDGEETSIGGLYSNESISLHQGIPFLKDLPWWFFGLRYVFGYETQQTQRRELVIVLRVDLIPTIEDRIAMRRGQLEDQEVLKEKLLEYDRDIYKYWDQFEDVHGNNMEVKLEVGD